MQRKLIKIIKIAAIFVVAGLAACWLMFWRLAHRVVEFQAAKAELSLTHVAGSVYMVDAVLDGRQIGGSVAASIGQDGVLLVDSTTATVLAKRLTVKLEEVRGGPAPVAWVINTHAHPDHVLGNATFGEQATIVAHRATSERLARPVKPFPWLPEVPPLPAAGLPDETFTGTRTLRFNGENVHLLHLAPGHTDGDTIVHFQDSNVVHVGDVFNGRGGRSVAATGYGGQLAGLRRALGELLERLPDDVRIVCGHGGVGQVASRRDLADYHQLLGEMIDLTRQRIAAGRSLEDVQAERLTDRFADWFADRRQDSVMHGPPESWQTSLYRTLAAETPQL